MNTLPEDVQIKIYKMAHQMKLMEVMSELISEFDYMCYLKAKKDYNIYKNYTNICPHRLINYHRERHYHATHVLRLHKSPEYLSYYDETNDNYNSDDYDSDESNSIITISEDESDN